MGRITQRMRILRVNARTPDDAGSQSDSSSVPRVRVREKNDLLAVEEPLELRVNGESFTVTMRTPGHDFELVAGFLFAEGIIASAEHLREQRYCAGTDEAGNQTYNVIDASLTPTAAAAGLGVNSVLQNRQVLTTSACGICGTTSIDAVEKTLPFTEASPQLRMSAETLLQLPESLRTQQRVFESTGGVHAAGLFDAEGQLLCLREDVGRHNAVDKVVGWALLQQKLPLRGTVLQVSGRASFELVQKAAMAGIEGLSAVGSPSSLAADLAQRTGLTLSGFSRGSSINIYTHAHRITGIDDDVDPASGVNTSPESDTAPEGQAQAQSAPGAAGRSQVNTHV